jgi:predicted nucleotidyltransferase
MSSKPDIAISDSEWQIVRDILQTYLPKLPVWAFGSRVLRTQKLFSDLDIAVITDHPMALSVLASLNEAFADSDLPWKVDIVDWACIGEDFRKIIEDHKVPLQ